MDLVLHGEVGNFGLHVNGLDLVLHGGMHCSWVDPRCRSRLLLNENMWSVDRLLINLRHGGVNGTFLLVNPWHVHNLLIDPYLTENVRNVIRLVNITKP